MTQSDIQRGPDAEQLGISEDAERLADIGDLIRAGHATLADFDLTKWELVFMDGYLSEVE
jgi:hypothetical protein